MHGIADFLSGISASCGQSGFLPQHVKIWMLHHFWPDFLRRRQRNYLRSVEVLLG